MGTTLTGTTPQDTYDSLIKVTDNGPLSGSLKTLTDGLGNDSALALSTGAASVTGTLAVSAGATLASVSGNVGIGAAPITKLSVVDGTNSYAATFDGAGGTSLVAIGTTSGGPSIAGYTAAFAASTNLLLNPDGGNVGINTSSPTGRLTVYGEVDVLADPAGAGYGSRIGMPFNVSTYDLAFYTRSNTATFTERVRILSGGGLTFNGDTAAANALDDYEEGTFTATLAPSTSGTITLSVNTCTYTKIGRQVTVKGFLTISSVASPVGTSVDIGGLPFTIINSTSGRGTFSFVVLDASAGYNAFTGATQHTANSTSIIAYYDASTLAASDEIMFTATYFV